MTRRAQRERRRLGALELREEALDLSTSCGLVAHGVELGLMRMVGPPPERHVTMAPPATTQFAQSAAVKSPNALPVRVAKAPLNCDGSSARGSVAGSRRGAANASALTGSAIARRRGSPGSAVALSQRKEIGRGGVGDVDRDALVRRLQSGAVATFSAMSFCFSRKLLASRAKSRAKDALCSKGLCVLRCGQIARSRWRCFGAPKRAARACENRFMQIAVPLFCQWLCASCGTPQTAKCPRMMVLVLVRIKVE